MTSNSITKPLAALLLAIRKVEKEGEFSIKVDSTSKDEVAEVANSLSSLLAMLENMKKILCYLQNLPFRENFLLVQIFLVIPVTLERL
ncbi:MAG: HAMP domain-containing protein [Leptospiraceae bacterium]|nr:HAMP domain-containing protein [Leptospiraceae bacterium]